MKENNLNVSQTINELFGAAKSVLEDLDIDQYCHNHPVEGVIMRQALKTTLLTPSKDLPSTQRDMGCSSNVQTDDYPSAEWSDEMNKALAALKTPVPTAEEVKLKIWGEKHKALSIECQIQNEFGMKMARLVAEVVTLPFFKAFKAHMGCSSNVDTDDYPGGEWSVEMKKALAALKTLVPTAEDVKLKIW